MMNESRAAAAQAKAQQQAHGGQALLADHGNIHKAPKQIQRCGLCGQQGHNKRSCPQAPNLDDFQKSLRSNSTHISRAEQLSSSSVHLSRLKPLSSSNIHISRAKPLSNSSNIHIGRAKPLSSISIHIGRPKLLSSSSSSSSTGLCRCDCPAVVLEEDTTAPLPGGEGPRQRFGLLLRQDNWAFELSLAVLVGSPGLLLGIWRFLSWVFGRYSRRNVPARSARRVIGREITQIASSGSSAVPRIRC